MLRKEVDVTRRCNPIPIAVLIKTANSFDCDIYIENGRSKVNVKNYEEMKRGLIIQDKDLLFYFDGRDEKAANDRIGLLFSP